MNRTFAAWCRHVPGRWIVALIGVSVSLVARGQAGLVLDPALKPDVLDPAAVVMMDAVARPDGDMIVAGQFIYVNGTAREWIVRLNGDGTIDPTLQPVEIDHFITRLALGPEGSIYVGGVFSRVAGVARGQLARLTAEGTLDTSFNPGSAVSSGYIHALMPTSDGGVYVVRALPQTSGSDTLRIDRLTSSGAVVAGFSPIVLADTMYLDMAVTPTGGVVLVSLTNGTSSFAQAVRRYLPTGAVDTTFQPRADLGFYPRTVILQAGGAMLLGGQNGSYGGQGLIRLLPNGTRDEAFDGSGPFQLLGLFDMVALSDGSVVASASGLDNNRPPAVVRFSNTGVYDATFRNEAAPRPDRTNLNLVALADGGFAVYGGFVAIGDAPVAHVARFEATGAIRPTVRTAFDDTGTIERFVPFAGGDMLVGGTFTRVGEHARGGVVRFAANDTVVTAFPSTSGSVSDIVVDSSGRAVVLGDFPAVTGTTSAGIFRAAANNQVDSAFLAGVETGITQYGAAAALADGSIVVVKHRYIPDYSVPGIRKILPTGGLDASFQLNTQDSTKGPDGTISALAVDAANRLILSAGSFGAIRIQGVERPCIARTDAAGLLDATFAPAVGLAYGGLRIVPRADGSFFILGRSVTAPDNTPNTLMRFLANGAIDPALQLTLADGEHVTGFTLTPDDALLVATSSVALGNRVRRFSLNGVLDTSFSIDAGPHGPVNCLAFDTQGRLWLGGRFVEINGQRRVGLARFALPTLHVAIDGPSQVIVAEGGSHTLATTVTGATGTVRYQWYRDGAAVDGAVGASLEVASFGPARAGSYTVTVTDASRTKTSNSVSLVLPIAPAITQQPGNVNGSLGGALVLRVVATGLPAPTYQWYRNGSALSGATESELRLRNLTASDAGTYTVRVSNTAGSVTSVGAVVGVVPVTIDAGFSPAAVAVTANTWVGLVAGRTNDSLYVSTYRGEALNGASRDGLYRLNPDGTLDTTFAVQGRRILPPLLVLADGTSYALEDIASLTETGTRLRRLSASGAVDAGFGPHFVATSDVCAVGVLADGRVVAAGGFTHVNGQARAGLVRFLADGSIDTAYTPPAGLSVADAVIAADGSAVVVLNENSQYVVRRVRPTGAFDASFPAANLGPNGQRVWLEAMPDGSTLLLGNFISVNGVARNQCARLLANGSLAPDFTSRPGGANVVRAAVLADGSVRCVVQEGRSGFSDERMRIIALDATGTVTLDQALTLTMNYSGSNLNAAILPSGAVVFAGSIIAVGGETVAGFVRYDAAGQRDPTYRARVGRFEWVSSACPLENGRWAIGGRFTELAGAQRWGLGVIGPDGSLDTTFVPELGENPGILRVQRLSGDRLLVKGYIPPFSGGMLEPSIVVLNADGSRDRSYASLFTTGVDVVAISPAGHVYLATPVANPPVYPTVRLTRLHADLTPDATFAPVTVQSGFGAEALSDGRLFVFNATGTVVDSAGTSRTFLCRLTSAGLVDTTFTPPVVAGGLFSTPRESPGGRFLIAGGFTSVNGVSRAAIARLNDDGSLDPTFVPPSSGLPANPSVTSFAVDEAGRVVVFGKYRSGSALGPNDSVLTRLLADGTWDSGVDYPINTFNSTGIEVIVPRENGDVLVAGSFAHLGGAPNLSIARITVNPFQASAVREYVSIPEGGTGYLDIRLTGGVELPRYRWTRDGLPLPEGDRAVFALRGFTAAEAGTYRAEVTSADGSTVQTETIEVALTTATSTAALTPLDFAETGGLGAIDVSAPGTATWTVTGVPAWAQLAPLESTTGSRTVSFELDPNRTGAERSATITVAGRDYLIRQRPVSGRLANISTRGRVGVGGDVLIVGIVTTGTGPADFLGRGVGPTLTRFGLSSVLPNPSIDLKQGQNTIGGNDDWDGGSDRDLILSETRRVGGFGLTAGAGDAALLTTLAPGSYTARIFDPAGGQGVALAEFYDRTPAAAADPYTRALNISTRGRVGAGADVLIAGFVITGSAPKQVLIRGVGPGLARFGITDHLADPFIRVVRQGVTVASNDDWAFSAQRGVVEAAARATSAFRLDPQGRDAALVATLAPGSYTAVLSGADGGEGVAIVEVYDME
jgi:uncharacterized delta-60 repeat protein